MFDNHVTFVAVFDQRQMTEMVEQKYNNLLKLPSIQQNELTAIRNLIMLESKIYHSV